MRRPLFFSLLFLAVLFAASATIPQTYAVKVGRNVNLSPDVSRAVVETFIAVDPRNPRVLVAGAGQDGAGYFSARGYWPRYFRSTDGGLTWSSRLLPGFPGDTSPEGLASPLRQVFGNGGAIDPGLAFDRSGNLYYVGLGGNFTASGALDFKSFRVFVAKFANDGADYVGATVLPTPTYTDFPYIAVDRSGGPNDGNVYVTFVCCADSGELTRSTDGGLTFSKPIGIPGPGGALGITVDPAGNVFALKQDVKGGGDTWLVAKSTDGGLTFDKSVVVAKVSPLPSVLGYYSSSDAPWIASDTSGVYVVGSDSSTGNTNIVFTGSTDGGLTWTKPTKVDDASQGSRFFATVAVSSGIISVAWYDSRLAQQQSNGTITGLDVFYAESRNLGSTFSKNVRVTGATFNPNLVFSTLFQHPFVGDYITIDASPTAAHIVWTDNRNACDTVDPTEGCIDQDVYTATITP